jgi:hypothetical protein
MDDPNTYETPGYSVEERNRLILGQLAARNVRIMLFVCGKRIDSPRGADLLRAFNDAGHLLANHSYEHRFYNSPESTAEQLGSDIAQCESLIAHHTGFRRRWSEDCISMECGAPSVEIQFEPSISQAGHYRFDLEVDGMPSTCEFDFRPDGGRSGASACGSLLLRGGVSRDLATEVVGYALPQATRVTSMKRL